MRRAYNVMGEGRVSIWSAEKYGWVRKNRAEEEEKKMEKREKKKGEGKDFDKWVGQRSATSFDENSGFLVDVDVDELF